ncbi:hypothetical protein ADL15_14390 [Actinoplanes awajinensis subsp. mycoplanecinus]|uniref:Uncharacterized protein n=1 Tax=Actinoplanes awajinensis subsp. mycoplanecinus TaxID=135947 RepID=A0A0X3UT19_9ACTN|nr:hypothetical protein ADL15_14390 [Actinoplanes awajinensis subsp. mycoplanecinus]
MDFAIVLRRLKYTELVAVRIGEDMPAPAVFLDRVFCNTPGTERHHSGRFYGQIGYAQVQM